MDHFDRRTAILDYISGNGYATIDELAQNFRVTPQTIRRDINQLANEGKLKRYHGGAGIDSSIQNTDYNDRVSLSSNQKQRIAAAVAAAIPNHCSLFINIGTTTEAIAQALLEHRGLRIITNNIHVATILSQKDDFDILLTGGTVRGDGGLVGQATEDFIEQFKVDFGILGISGIDEDGSLLDFDYQEVHVSRAIMNNSRQLFLAADHSKFGRNAVVRLDTITRFHHVFTDSKPSPAICQLLDEHSVQLTLAG